MSTEMVRGSHTLTSSGQLGQFSWTISISTGPNLLFCQPWQLQLAVFWSSFPAPPGGSQTSTRGIPHIPHPHNGATSFPHHLQSTWCSVVLCCFSFLLKIKPSLSGFCSVSEMAQVGSSELGLNPTSLSGSWSSLLFQTPQAALRCCYPARLPLRYLGKTSSDLSQEWVPDTHS